MSREYTVNAECDWCEETKQVRYLYDNEIPVLAICKDCDIPDVNTSTEFPEHHNNKENTAMNDQPSTISIALLEAASIDDLRDLVSTLPDDHDLIYVAECILNHKVAMETAEETYRQMSEDDLTQKLYDVYEEGAEIARDPFSYSSTEEHQAILSLVDEDLELIQRILKEKENPVMSTTKTTCDVRHCGSTGKFHMLVWALDYNAYALDKLPESYKDGGWQQIELNFCGTHRNVLHRGNAVKLALPVGAFKTYKLDNPEEQEQFSTEVLGNEPKMTPRGYHEKHHNPNPDPTCEFCKEEKEETKEVTVKTSNKQIHCGKCKGYHNTPAEVAECYGVERKSTTRNELVVTKGKYTRKWFENQRDAVAHVKSLESPKKGVQRAQNQHGYWAWWQTNS